MGTTNPPTVLVLADADDLRRAYAGATWLRRERVDHVLVALRSVPEPTRAEAARRVRRHLNACGCRAGEAALVLALAVALLIPWHPVGPAPTAVLVVLAGLAGRLLGLAWSRRQLRNDLRGLAAHARLDLDAPALRSAA